MEIISVSHIARASQEVAFTEIVFSSKFKNMRIFLYN